MERKNEDEEVQTQTQPDTAPLDSDSDVKERNHSWGWGKLIPLVPNLPLQVLIEESYKAGRSPLCEIYLNKIFFEDTNYNSISKIHFQITRTTLDDNIKVIHLEDLSSNGTYVNGKILGKNKVILLKNCDEISLPSCDNKVFIFIDENVEDPWLAPEMRLEYQVLKHLGSGGFSEVKLVIHKSFRQFAMKKVLKSQIETQKTYKEIEILQRVNNPFIIKLEEVIDTSEAIFISLEYMVGGDLYNKMKQRKKLYEPEARNIFYQLAMALNYLHELNITHRDIKAQNVLLSNSGDMKQVHIKLADFGLSKDVSALQTRCGTLHYMAPEILYSPGHACYTNAVDIWSLGVLLYFCLSGSFPFAGEQNVVLVKQIVQGAYDVRSPKWFSTSHAAIHLIQNMLVVNPLKRISISDILEHRWLKDYKWSFEVQQCSSSSGAATDENAENIIPPQPPKRQRLEQN